jgi:negative regulator of sigma E activity
VLRYHSRSGAVTAAVLQLNGNKREVLHRETLTTLGGFSAEDPREGGG